MSKILRTDFAKKYRLKTATLRVYINRGKVVASGDYIDESLQINKEFIQNRLAKIGKPVDISKPKKEKVEVVEVEKNGHDKTSKAESPPNFEPVLRSLDSLKAEKIEAETRILVLREAKMRGEVVPVDLIKPVFIQFSKSMTTAFQNEAENMLVEIGHKSKLNRTEKAELRQRFRAIINEAVQDGVKDTKKNIVHIARDYSEVRGKGENK